MLYYLWGSALQGLKWTSCITICMRIRESSEVLVIHGSVCLDRHQTEELFKIHTYKPRIFDNERSVCAKRGL